MAVQSAKSFEVAPPALPTDTSAQLTPCLSRRLEADYSLLEGLRGLLILPVLLFHSLFFVDMFGLKPHNFAGCSMVISLFFVLSGLFAGVKFQGIAEKSENVSKEEARKLQISGCAYTWDRFTKFAVMHFTCLLLNLPGLLAVFYMDPVLLRERYQVSENLTPTMAGVIASGVAVFVGPVLLWFETAATMWNLPCWFLCQLMVFSLFMPCMGRCLLRAGQSQNARRRNLRCVWVITSLSFFLPMTATVLVYFGVGPAAVLRWVHMCPVPRFLEVCLGILIGAELSQGRFLPAKKCRVLCDLLFFLFLLCAIVPFLLGSHGRLIQIGSLVGFALQWLPIWPLWVYLLCHPKGFRGRCCDACFDNRLMSYLGRLSFGLFITHFPLLQLVAWWYVDWNLAHVQSAQWSHKTVQIAKWKWYWLLVLLPAMVLFAESVLRLLARIVGVKSRP